MSNVTECYKALEGAVPAVQTSPFSELLLVIELECWYRNKAQWARVGFDRSY